MRVYVEKTKIAIITNIPSPYRIPLFEKIAKKVDLFVYFMSNSEKEREWDVKLSEKFKYKILNGFNLMSIGFRLNYNINLSIINEIHKNDYDVVIVGGYSSLTTQLTFLLCKLKKIPIILWSGNTIHDDNLLRKFTLPLTRFLIRKSDAFVVYGTRAKEYVVSLGIPKEKIFIAINVGDVEFFCKENERLKKHKKENKKNYKIKNKYNLLFVGRLISIKGVEYLIEAYKKLIEGKRDFGLIIVGDGPLKEKLEMQCKSLENIYFIKFVQPSELPIYYSLADVFILPSFHDRFALVLSEAMASSLPIIATRNNGASIDLIKEGYNGYIVEEKSYYEIYNAIIKIFKDPIHSKKMEKTLKK